MALCENSCNSTLDKNMEATTKTLNAIPEDFFAYKVSVFIYLYLTVPIAVWGWIGNGLSFRVMVLPRNRKTSANIFLAALACSDSVHLLFTVHIWCLNLLQYRSDWMCKMTFWYGLVGRCSSYAFIIIVTLQRCVAITMPLKQMEWMSVKSAKTKIIPLVIFINIAYKSYTVLLLTEADGGNNVCNKLGGNPTIARIASLLTLVIDILIPFVSISTLNAILIRAVRHRSKELESFSGSGTISTVTVEVTSDNNKRDKGRKSREGHQLTVTLIFVCVAFLVLASPILIVEAILTFVSLSTSPQGLANVTLIKTVFQRLIHINAGINFWLYCSSGKRFREDLKSFFCTPSSGNAFLGSSLGSHSTDMITRESAT